MINGRCAHIAGFAGRFGERDKSRPLLSFPLARVRQEALGAEVRSQQTKDYRFKRQATIQHEPVILFQGAYEFAECLADQAPQFSGASAADNILHIAASLSLLRIGNDCRITNGLSDGLWHMFSN